jgi:hypothetical protein
MSKSLTQAQELAKRQALLRKEACRRDPIYWIANYVKTEKTGKNRKEDENAIQPFPVNLPYVKPFVENWRKNSTIHIVKSRQMMISWLCQIMLMWEAQFRDNCLNVVISKTEDASVDEIRRCKTIYLNQPEWLKNQCPLARQMESMPADSLLFANGSRLVGLPQGAHKIRGLVPATVLLDEAAYIDDLEATFSASTPCASRVVTVSSAGPGYFRRLCCG